MLPKRPPPLQWLPAFEATARNLSIKQAAQELHVTSSAVSQQIKSLEQYLDLSLFERQGRGLRLSEAAQAYLPLVQRVLQQHRQAYEGLLSQIDQDILRVNMTPFVANEIIIPNLADFQQQYPQIQLRIETSSRFIDFNTNPAHAALRWVNELEQVLCSEFICSCTINVIAAPSLLAQKPIKALADLEQHIWIQPNNEIDYWQAFLNLTGSESLSNQGELLFDNELAASIAVEQGLGVMVATMPVFKTLVNDGRAELAFSESWPSKMKTVLAYRPQDQDRPAVKAFADWCRGLYEQI